MRRSILPLLGVGAAVAVLSVLPVDPGAGIAPVKWFRSVPMPERVLTAPEPTEHHLEDDAEEKNKERRKEWREKMHRSPPDVDWTSIERRNGRDAVARRAARKGAPPAEHGTWVERGSDNMAGRMHVGVPGTDGETLYGGTSNGGVWKGTLDGEGWTPIGDNLYGGAHWLAVLPADDEGDPDIVLAATDGGLIHRSTDGGESWEVPTGLGNTWSVRRLLHKSDGSDTLFMVVHDSGGGVLVRSTDKGASFEEVYDLGGTYGDAWTPRDGGGELYLANVDSVLLSDDDGETWETVGTLPATTSRVELTGSEAGAPRLWAVGDSTTLYRSDDAGETWSTVGTLSDYWGALCASIVDEDLFAWGGMEFSRTFDGGDSSSIINAWWDYYGDPANLLHADVMGIDVYPDGDGETWYISTDGGLYHSLDGLSTVQNLSLRGLRVSQYYDVLTSTANPDHVLAGAQDQGYQATTGVEQDGDVLQFTQVWSGDYGHLTSGDGSHEWVYSVYPGFILVHHGEDSIELSTLEFPAGESYVPWLPPVVADPDDNENFFFAASHLYEYTHLPSGWSSSQWSAQDFAVNNGEYLSALAFSPLDSDRVYAASSNGRFWYSSDKGRTWTQSQSLVADENWYYGQAIVASNRDVDTVYVGGSGYGVPAVYRSTDGGYSFEPWGDGLPSTLVYSMAEASLGSGVLVVGTESSAYRRDPGEDEWTEITENASPITIYWSVEALDGENTFRFGTYGRGIWDYEFEPPEPTGDGGDDTDGGGGDGGSGDAGAAVGDGGEEEPDDCGCATGGTAGWLGMLVGLGAAVRRRRW